MKTYFFVLLFTTILFSCREIPSSQQKQQDSLYTLLRTQINELKSISNFSYTPIHSPPYSDTLSHIDSILYQNILHNYIKASAIIESIQHIVPTLLSEADTLSKYSSIRDTVIVRRLEYLTKIHQTYIQEYYKSSSIIEQNRALLNIIFSHQQH